jgi:hypothetical protein
MIYASLYQLKILTRSIGPARLSSPFQLGACRLFFSWSAALAVLSPIERPISAAFPLCVVGPSPA